MKHLTWVALLALTVTGCQETPAVSAAPSSSLPAHFDAAAQGVQFARNTDASVEDRMEAAAIAMTTTFDIAATTDTWQEAHGAVQEAVSSAASDLNRSTIEQATAKMMLTGHLARHADDPDAARVALGYAERLVELRSPEAEVVLAAAETFRSSWADDDVDRLARRAARNIEAYVTEGGSCEDCDRSADVERALRLANQAPDAWETRQAEAARALTALVR